MVFTIKDNEGNFVSKGSFQNYGNKKWLYISWNGRCEMARWYKTQVAALNVLQYLTDMNMRLKLHKQFFITEENLGQMKEGDKYIQEINL